MKARGHYDPSRDYMIAGKLLNELIGAANEWRNLVVVDVVRAGASRIVRAEGRTILEIAHPPTTSGLPENVTLTEVTLCEPGSSDIIKTFLTVD